MEPQQSSLLIVLHDFTLGGTERIAVRLASAWAERGVAVTIFAGSSAGPLARLASPKVKIVHAQPEIARGPRSMQRLGAAAKRFAEGRHFDCAFIPGNFHWPVAPYLAACGIPVVAQISAALRKPQRGPVKQSAFEMRMRHLLGKTAAVVALCDSARDRADRILGRRIAETIHLPALSENPEVPLPVLSGAAPIILGAGRLVPEKGFDLLIDAFTQMHDRTARLVIVGDGPEKGALQQLANKLGAADRVEFPGYVADTRPWLDRARLFVLPSDYEGYAAVVVEALAAGRPVVSTNCTPATKLLTGPGVGAVVPIRDPAALAQAMAKMLRQNPPDPALLSQSVAKYRIGPIAEAYLALFASCSRAKMPVAGLATGEATGQRRRPSAIRVPQGLLPTPAVPSGLGRHPLMRPATAIMRFRPAAARLAYQAVPVPPERANRWRSFWTSRLASMHNP